MILNVRVAFYPGHVRPVRQCLGNIARAFYQNCVHNVEGLMLESAFAQPLQEWALRRQTLIQQCAIDVASFLSLGLQGGGLTQIGLVGKHDEKFSSLSVGCVFHYPRRNLVCCHARYRPCTLPCSMRRGDRSYSSYDSCAQEQ